jgi:hypothetical protein
LANAQDGALDGDVPLYVLRRDGASAMGRRDSLVGADPEIFPDLRDGTGITLFWVYIRQTGKRPRSDFPEQL